jgi:hypothetical protein
MKQTRLLIPLVTAILTACPTETKPVQVSIDPPVLALPVGAGQAFTATITDTNGNPVAGQAVSWVSSNPSVASITPAGMVAAVAEGQTTITATVGSVASNVVTLSVVPTRKGVATLAAPSANNPGATKQVSVVVYDDYALFEGDIIIDLSSLKTTTAGIRPQGNVIPAQKGSLWPNRTLTYYLEPGLPQEIQDKINQAASILANRANITLKQIFSKGGDYVHVLLADPKKPICGDSKVGRQGGEQMLHFQKGCRLRTYLHEFGHALGLQHEQSRNDRDNYITVLYNNIIDGYKDQYDKSGSKGVPNHTYDYESIMHYPVFNSFSRLDKNNNALPTFSVNGFFDPGKIGTGNDLSQGDLLALSHLYGNITPTISLIKPASNTAQVEISHPMGFDMEANVSDVEDGNACCKLTWWAWKDGLVDATTGPHSKVNFQFKTLGPQLVTVTAEDSKGATDSLTFTVNVVHAAPLADIAQPTANQTVYRNKPFQLVADTGHPSNTFLKLTCTWNIPGVNPSPKGCSSSVLLGSSVPKGSVTISLTVTDQYNGSTTRTVNVNVDELATLGVSITDPINNSAATVGDYLFMRSVVVNGQTPVNKVWTWKANKQGCAPQTLTLEPPITVPIGNIPDGFWNTTGQQNMANGCGFDNIGGTLTVTVTDGNNQTASDSITFKLTYVPPPN